MLARSLALCLCLSVAGTRFAVDGNPRWLAGVSLFDALGTTAPRDQDLDAIAKWGVTLVRVWAHWSDPIYDARGALRAAGKARLIGLADRLRDRGLALELVLLRPGQLRGQRFALFESPDARLRAVRDITTALQPYRNVIFDLYNEHDHADGPIGHRELRVLRDAVKAIDRDRLVTVSSTEYHFLDAKSALGPDGLANLRAEVGPAGDAVAVDVLAVHPPGTADWADATAVRLRTIRDALRESGRDIPIYLNEGPRARPGEPPIAADRYVTAATQSREAGAAGWVFHTAAGFALGKTTFLGALTQNERLALEKLR